MLTALGILPIGEAELRWALLIFPACVTAYVSIPYLFGPAETEIETEKRPSDGLPINEEGNDIRVAVLMIIHTKRRTPQKPTDEMLDGLSKLFSDDTLDRAFDYVLDMETKMNQS